jgi:hypothetical protein
MKNIKIISLVLLILFGLTVIAFAAQAVVLKFKDNTYTYYRDSDLNDLYLSISGFNANIDKKVIDTNVVDFWAVCNAYGSVVVWELEGNNFLYALIYYKDGSILSKGYLFVDKYPVKTIQLTKTDDGAIAKVIYETGGSKNITLRFKNVFPQPQ